MSGKQIPSSWIAERLAAYQSSDSRTRQDAQRELFERLLPRILQSAMAYQRNSMLASCSTHLAEDAAAYVCMMLLRRIDRGIAAKDVTVIMHSLFQSFFEREMRQTIRSHELKVLGWLRTALAKSGYSSM